MAEKREMTAIEFLKCKGRICKTYRCNDCPIWKSRPNNSEGCGIFLIKYPDKAVAIVQKWSEEHPQKTFLSDFLEKYPNAPINERGFPDNFCPCDLGYTDEECISPSLFNDRCKECWSRPLEE